MHRESCYPGKKNYIFSRYRRRTPPKVQFVSTDIGEFSKQIRGAPGKDVWLVGGGELIAGFLDEQQIDQFIIHVIPIFIGEGIPLIQPRHRSVQLGLLSSRRYSDGVVRLHYRVLRPTPVKKPLKKSAR